MMKVCVLVATLLLVALGEPKLPKRTICSIQGTGTATWKAGTDISRSGSLIMKRVDEYAIYNFTDSQDRHYGYLLLRPDSRSGIYSCCEKSGSSTRCTGGTLGDALPLSTYSYYSDFKPVSGMDYNCFAHSSNSIKTAAFLFSKDGTKTLLGEWFDFGGATMTFKYSSISQYQHNSADYTFSLVSKGAPWNSKASGALTKYCEDVFSSSSTSPASSSRSPHPTSSSRRSTSSSLSTSAAGICLPCVVALLVSVIALIVF